MSIYYSYLTLCSRGSRWQNQVSLWVHLLIFFTCLLINSSQDFLKPQRKFPKGKHLLCSPILGQLWFGPPVNWPAYNLDHSVLRSPRCSVYHAFKDWPFGCFLREKNVSKWLLFRDYKPLLAPCIWHCHLLKITRFSLDP